jgi:glycosyltransferase involved in cell wall biosynthesis
VNLAYVSRRIGWDGHDDVGAYFSNAVRSMVGAGHGIYLITQSRAHLPSARLPAEVVVLPVQPADPKLRHFSELHQYADRVYTTLDALCRRTRIDAIEFSQDGAEGFSTVRAKRTLGRFADTRLVVRMHTPQALTRQATGYGPTDFCEEIRLFAEDYCIAHADAIVTPTASLAQHVQERYARTPATQVPYPLAAVDPVGTAAVPGTQPRELLFIGALAPANGADLFIKAAGYIAEQEPRFRFRMLGPDTRSDPFGSSYRGYLEARMPPRVSSRLSFHPLPPEHLLHQALPPFSLCLFPARWADSPYELLQAMGHRAVVLVSRHGGMPELIEDGETGLVVDPDDPRQVAQEVLRVHADRAAIERLGSRANQAVLRRCSPEAVRLQMQAVYGRSLPAHTRRTATDRPRVSVVIPVFNKGRYVGETVRSARASHYDDVEIVVVNDGSTDPQTNRELHSLSDVVMVEHASNRGVAAARNTGIAASSGRFVMPLDADDLIHPSYIPKAVEALLRNRELAYAGCYSQNFGLLDTTYVPVGYVPNLMLFLHTDGRCTKLFSREALDRVGGYDEELPAFEDWDLYLCLAKNGLIGDVIPEQLFLYRRHKDSTVFTWSNDKRIELLQYLMRKHRDVLADRYEAVVLHLLHLWKTYYEVSESVLLQRGQQASPGSRPSC